MFEIILNEAVHSVANAPLYVSLQRGYFKKHNLKVKLETGNCDKQTMDAILSGACTIGLLGPENIIYHFEKHKGQPVFIFAQLTSRAGSFLVSKKEQPDFQWEDLKNTALLSSNKENLAYLILDYILKSHYVDTATQTETTFFSDYSKIEYEFAKGSYDFCLLNEPEASNLEKTRNGFLAASLGIDCGYLPNAAFCASQAVIEKYPVMIQDFTNSLQEAMTFIQNETLHQIAKTIGPQFPACSLSDLAVMIGRYKKIGIWNEHLLTVQKNYQLLIKIMLCGSLLTELVPYDRIFKMNFAKRAYKVRCQF